MKKSFLCGKQRSLWLTGLPINHNELLPGRVFLKYLGFRGFRTHFIVSGREGGIFFAFFLLLGSFTLDS